MRGRRACWASGFEAGERCSEGPNPAAGCARIPVQFGRLQRAKAIRGRGKGCRPRWKTRQYLQAAPRLEADRGRAWQSAQNGQEEPSASANEQREPQEKRRGMRAASARPPAMPFQLEDANFLPAPRPFTACHWCKSHTTDTQCRACGRLKETGQQFRPPCERSEPLSAAHFLPRRYLPRLPKPPLRHRAKGRRAVEGAMNVDSPSCAAALGSALAATRAALGSALAANTSMLRPTISPPACLPLTCRACPCACRTLLACPCTAGSTEVRRRVSQNMARHCVLPARALAHTLLPPGPAHTLYPCG